MNSYHMSATTDASETKYAFVTNFFIKKKKKHRKKTGNLAHSI